MRYSLRLVQALQWHWIWLWATLAAAQTNINTTYFLVTQLPKYENKRDSYVLPLSRAEDIAHARDLIVRGPWNNHAMVGARIAVGSDGINRNYRVAGCPQWSWHVVEFGGFGDVSAEIYDGSPTQTERDAQNLPAGYELIIGYWNYTVTRELGPEPICLCAQTNSSGLHFTWHGVSTNYVYTLESTDSLSKTNWSPVAGGPWPTKTNQWTVPLAAVSNRFFRVKAMLQQ